MIDSTQFDKRIQRRFAYLGLYLLLALPWIVTGAVQVLSKNANSPLDWVSSDFAPRVAYDRFSHLFGAADVVVISWPECTVDNPAIDKFIRVLREAEEFQYKGQWLFESVVCGREMLHRLQGDLGGLPAEPLLSRLPQNLVGHDKKTTAVVIAFSGEGLRQREVLVPMIRLAAVRYGDASIDELHLAGPVVDGYEVDVASKSAVHRLAPITLLISFLICYLFLDSLYAALVVFTTALLSQGTALAIIYYSGGQMSALMIVVPPLLQILAIAGGIHFVNYYYAELRRDNDVADKSVVSPIFNALKEAWLPCTLSSVTTAFGIASLSTSKLEAVRDFGIYAAIGVLVTLAFQLTIIPGCFWFRPIKLHLERSRTADQHWDRLFRFVCGSKTLLSVLGLTCACSLGVGVYRLQPSVRIETLFASDSQLLTDYRWIETNVGPMVPIEAMVTFSQSPEASLPHARQVLEGLANQMRRVPTISAVFDPTALVDPPSELQSPQLLAGLNYLCAQEGKTHYRITAFSSALNKEDYSQTLDVLKARIDSYMVDWKQSARVEGAVSVEVELCGLMPLVHEIQAQLLQDLYVSFLLAFGLIGLVMTIVLGSARAAALSMIPNVFPGITLFGILGWIGQPLDIGSIMTASVAMGIAVDDTLHFLNYFQKQLRLGNSREVAVQRAYHHCGRAMLQTTLICACGLAAFALSEFVPTARFAWMMVVLMMAALLGDLLLLPALLLGPLGKYFER